MTTPGGGGGGRAPTFKERENNKRRERKRRAIASRIFAGLRQYGNYKLPKHCDNNEVLKALCREAGWTVEDDGTTYKTGCKRALDLCASSTSTSAASSSYGAPGSVVTAATSNAAEGMSLIPWLKSAASPVVASASSASRNPNPNCGLPPLQIMRGGTCSAPVTPPLGSPRASINTTATAGAARPIEWMDSTVSARGSGCESSDCAAAAFSNACKGAPPRSATAAVQHQTTFMAAAASSAASGTSTPTYPPVFCASSVSAAAAMAASASARSLNPNQSNSSGPPTPFLHSGASTPTRCSNLLGFNFAAGAAATLMAAQKLHGEVFPSSFLMMSSPQSLVLSSAKVEQKSAMETEDGKRPQFFQEPPSAPAVSASLSFSSCAGMASAMETEEAKRPLFLQEPLSAADILAPMLAASSHEGMAVCGLLAMETTEDSKRLRFLQESHYAPDLPARLTGSSCATACQSDGRNRWFNVGPSSHGVVAGANPRGQAWPNPVNAAAAEAAPMANGRENLSRPAPMSMVVRAWEGEVPLGEEELELTLGNSMTKASPSSAATPEASSRTASAMCLD